MVQKAFSTPDMTAITCAVLPRFQVISILYNPLEYSNPIDRVTTVLNTPAINIFECRLVFCGHWKHVVSLLSEPKPGLRRVGTLKVHARIVLVHLELYIIVIPHKAEVLNLPTTLCDQQDTCLPYSKFPSASRLYNT